MVGNQQGTVVWVGDLHGYQKLAEMGSVLDITNKIIPFVTYLESHAQWPRQYRNSPIAAILFFVYSILFLSVYFPLFHSVSASFGVSVVFSQETRNHLQPFLSLSPSVYLAIPLAGSPQSPSSMPPSESESESEFESESEIAPIDPKNTDTDTDTLTPSGERRAPGERLVSIRSITDCLSIAIDHDRFRVFVKWHPNSLVWISRTMGSLFVDHRFCLALSRVYPSDHLSLLSFRTWSHSYTHTHTLKHITQTHTHAASRIALRMELIHIMIHLNWFFGNNITKVL